MKQNRITATAFVLLVLSSSVAAETAYVTDRLLLGLYAEADSNSQQYRTLPSGTRLDILERQGLYARIITDDGLEGWVKYHFLVTEPPAVVRIKTLEEQIEAGGQPLTDAAVLNELNELRSQNLALNEKLLQTEGELALAQQALSDQMAATTAEPTPAESPDQLAAPASDAADPPDEAAPTVPPAAANMDDESDVVSGLAADTFPDRIGRWVNSNPWAVGGLLIGTVPGFLIGANWMSRRVRRRFSGLRVW